MYNSEYCRREFRISMATFADYDDDNDGGDDNSSVTICPDIEGDADSQHSPSHVSHHNGIQTPTPQQPPITYSATSTTNSADIISSRASHKCLGKSKATPHNGTKAAIENHYSSQNKSSNNDGIDDVAVVHPDEDADVTIDNAVGQEEQGEGEDKLEDGITRCGPIACDANNVDLNASATNSGLLTKKQQHRQQQQQEAVATTSTNTTIIGGSSSTLTCAKNLLLCRRFKDSGDSLRNFTSLPLFIYATSPSTHATSADGVGVAQVAVKAAEEAAAAAQKKKVR